jgi:hypothetical protein
MTATTELAPEILAPEVWLELRLAHERRVEPWIAARLQRGLRGEKHPVDDFLFEYYGYRPGLLRRWHPGLGIALAGDAARDYLAFSSYAECEGAVTADPMRLSDSRREGLRWLANFLSVTHARAPQFGCAGLHEWAMVFRANEVRHATWSLRLSMPEIDGVITRQGLRCSHFDAFRFFTPEARPFNRWQPSREGMPKLEQRGCLHTNMDLYKWSQKLAPFADSRLMADCFELARDARELDMRASPYDLSALGYHPVKIETPAGRQDYELGQRALADRAQPLRARLQSVCDRVIALWA